MIRKSPFTTPFNNKANNDNMNSNYNNNINQNQPNSSSNTPPSHMPPTKNQVQAFNSQNTEKVFNPPPPKLQNQNTNPSKTTQPYPSQNQLNYLEDKITDEEFDQIKNEFELKYSPLNCSSEYISTSSNIFPSNIETLSKLSLPISISLCPMKNTGLSLPLINYGEHNIPRCPNRDCRAYLNPFVKFINGGEKWICNLCGQINNTEEYYYCDVDKNGERLDINQKEELCCG